jgi:hypothetical protein
VSGSIHATVGGVTGEVEAEGDADGGEAVEGEVVEGEAVEGEAVEGEADEGEADVVDGAAPTGVAAAREVGVRVVVVAGLVVVDGLGIVDGMVVVDGTVAVAAATPGAVGALLALLIVFDADRSSATTAIRAGEPDSFATAAVSTAVGIAVGLALGVAEEPVCCVGVSLPDSEVEVSTLPPPQARRIEKGKANSRRTFTMDRPVEL